MTILGLNLASNPYHIYHNHRWTKEAEEKSSFLFLLLVQPSILLSSITIFTLLSGSLPEYHHEKESGRKQEFRPFISSSFPLRFRLNGKHVRILIRIDFSTNPKNQTTIFPLFSSKGAPEKF